MASGYGWFHPLWPAVTVAVASIVPAVAHAAVGTVVGLLVHASIAGCATGHWERAYRLVCSMGVLIWCVGYRFGWRVGVLTQWSTLCRCWAGKGCGSSGAENSMAFCAVLFC